MYKGSCLCGGVQVHVTGPIQDIIHCHCSLCRKSSGTAYATNGFVSVTDFNIACGSELLTSYEFKPGKLRHFCKVCASPIYSSNMADPRRIRIRLGIFDSEIEERPMSHNFVTSKANWDTFEQSLPQYEMHEPSRNK